jgi:uncharacterized circularly permuted ATP-grasp superfamily protein
VLDNIGDLVVKEVHGSGGYGMLVGPTSTKAHAAEFRRKIEARPDNYIVQPTLALEHLPHFRRTPASPRATWICGPMC